MISKDKINLKRIFITFSLILLIITIGFSFAYFSDRIDGIYKGTAGNFDISITSNIGRGYKDDLIPGTIVPSSINIKNVGNKSADVRTKILIEVYDAEGNPVDIRDGNPFSIYYTKDMDIQSNEMNQSYYTIRNDATILKSSFISNQKKMYTLDPITLNGNKSLSKREVENGISSDTYNYNLCIFFNLDPTNKDMQDFFKDCTLKITILTEGKQHRNTTAGWNIIKTEKYNFGGETVDAVLKK